jgi:hypothetical protein
MYDKWLNTDSHVYGDEFESTCKEAVVAEWKQFPGSCVEGLRKQDGP